MSLPVLPKTTPASAPPLRRSRSARWRAGVLISVHGLIALHIAHWLARGETVTPVEPSEAMAFVKGDVVNAGLIFFAAAILLTAVFGRFFCGWGCHLVALQDLCRWLLGKVGIRPKPLRSRLLALVPALAFAYMFLWPLAYRLGVGDAFGPPRLELTTTQFWATFPGWVVGVLTFLVCGFASVYFLGAKGFCTYACPYGAIFAAAERVSPLRVRVTDACAGCAHCTAVCSSNVRVHEEVRTYGMVVDSGCMKCLDCVSVCPNDALYYGAGPLPLGAKPRRGEEAPRRRSALAWWEEGLLAAAFAAAFFTFRGLYGAVPFLMALGLAGVLACGALLTARLLRRPHLRFHRLTLKRDGRLLPAGVAVFMLAGAGAALWGHSAWVRYHAAAGERAARALIGAAAPLPRGQRDRLEAALGHLETVTRRGLLPTPGNAAERARLHLLAGDDARAAGRLATAAAAYERALALAPETPGPYVGLGVLLAESGRLEEAAEIFERGRRRVPASPRLTYNLGLVRVYQGNGPAAATLFEETLALAPDHRQARDNLAALRAEMWNNKKGTR